MRTHVFPAEQARRRQRDFAAGGFLDLAAGVEHLLRELALQALEATGEGLELVAAAGIGVAGRKAGDGQGGGDQAVAEESVHGEPGSRWNWAASVPRNS